MSNKMKKKVICGIIFTVILVAALFITNRLFAGKVTCTGVITNRVGEWEYGPDCFIVIDSKYGGLWIVYESLEEINERFHKELAYGDRVWISYTTDGYEIAPQQMEVVYILELKDNSTPAFEINNISKIACKFGPLEEVKSVFMNYKNGIEIDEYVVLEDLPENVSEYIVECMEGLKHEGKKVATHIKEDKVVALVGYQES